MNPPPSQTSDPACENDVRLAAAGDRNAFSRLVLRYQDDVVSAARHYLGNFEDAVDAAQEAFLRAFSGIRGFEGSASFKTWLLRITINTAHSLSARNRAKKRSATVLRLDHAVRSSRGAEECELRLEVASSDASANPSALLEKKELKESLEAAIQNLDAEAREIILLRDIAGESYESIAASLKLPLGTVKSRVHRARLEIREKIAKFL